MKTLAKIFGLAFLALYFTACAHERTEMDRELALKLVDKAGRIEIVQSGGSPMLNVGPTAQAQHPQDQTCTSGPIYNLQGQYVRTATSCY